MLVFGTRQESLPVQIKRDATTGLPLLDDQNEILQLILAYLALPYSVTEYGCGKKASLIIDYLLWLEIPSYAIARGLALERDMSPEALEEKNYENREHALSAINPLSRMSDLTDPKLQRMIVATCPGAFVEEYTIRTGPARKGTNSYVLRNTPHVQFVHARSHVYPILYFWDNKNHSVAKRVVDPSIKNTELFPVPEVRRLLDAPECLLFEASLMNSFRLDTDILTSRQKSEIGQPDTCQMTDEEHARFIRSITGASIGSIGDPQTWTYANNVPDSDDEHHEVQKYNTRRTDTGILVRKLCEARQNRSAEAPEIRVRLRAIEQTIEIQRIAREDAWRAERQLAPLADVTMTVVYFNTLVELARCIRARENPLQYLRSNDSLDLMRGIATRLRRRIDWLASASREDDGKLDGRTLTPGFVRAMIETIRQMNEAGLTVCIDKAGNCHGILLDQSSREAVENGELKLKGLLRNAIVLCSHIDTVYDAGRFNGRSGVASGIETAHIIEDLYRYMNLETRSQAGPVVHNDGTGLSLIEKAPVRLMVSAFTGHEMTFSGSGISMPGSSAVSGLANMNDIHSMQNREGEIYKNRLLQMLVELQQLQEAGFDLLNDFRNKQPDQLLDACFEPTDFYSNHSYERAIEQGDILATSNTPMLMVNTITGIQQEDIYITSVNNHSPEAEAAALEINRRMREIALEPQFQNIRATAGIIEGYGPFTCHEDSTLAMRWILHGQTNHAGATELLNRKDAGVAAARLAGFFLHRVQEINERRNTSPADHNRLSGVVGNIKLDPGVDRNVIPGSAALSMAVVGDHLSVDEQEELIQSLQGYAIGTLQKRVQSGGESLCYCSMDQMSYANIYHNARISIDFRSMNKAVSEDFRNRIGALLPFIQKQFNVSVYSEVIQRSEPICIQDTGQCLLLERSYGGGHNPNEAEFPDDLIRGSILQFSILRELMQGDGLCANFNLPRFVNEIIPARYRNKQENFVSGSLYDSGNIARGVKMARTQHASYPEQSP